MRHLEGWLMAGGFRARPRTVDAFHARKPVQNGRGDGGSSPPER
jgi:hypothetical protein